MSLTVTDPNILSSFPTWASTVSVTVDIFLACPSISSFSFLAFSAATRFVCSKDLILRSFATTAFLRGSKKFLANPSLTSMRSPRWPTPSIVSCRMTFIPLTPSVGKEKRILEGLKKSRSRSAHTFILRVSHDDRLALSSLDSRRQAPVSGPRPRFTMTARDLIEQWTGRFADELKQLEDSESSRPFAPVTGRLLQTVGTLCLYEFRVPLDRPVPIDIPVSIVVDDYTVPVEGVVLSCKDGLTLVQTFEAMGPTVTNAALVPDPGGFLAKASERFAHMLSQPDS